MNTGKILDAPVRLKNKEPKTWIFAFISIFLLSFFFFFSAPSSKSEKLFIENIGILATLYFFIKKVKIKNLNHSQFFFWCNFIVFTSHLFVFFAIRFMGYTEYLSISRFSHFSSIFLLKSILNGYVLGLGVYSAISLRTGAPIAFAILISGVFTIGIIHNL